MEEKNNQKPSILKEAFLKWIGLFLVIVAALAVFFVVYNADNIMATIGSYVGILRPVVYGCVIAYILNPLMKTFQECFRRIFERKGKQLTKKKKQLITGISITLSMLSGIVIILVLCWMVIPQLVSSVYSLIETYRQKQIIIIKC